MGKTRKEAEDYYTPPTQPLLDWRPYLGGETWREFYLRVARCMERITKFDDSLLIVCHGGTVVNVLVWWLRVPIENLSDITFVTNNTGITILIETKLGQRAVERHNDVAHLNAESIAPSFPNISK